MGFVVEVITALEKTTITKEALESTRLGKHINELRRKTSNDALAKRAKDLVRRWRGLLLPPAQATPQPTVADTAPTVFNGTNTQNLALRNLKPQSPAFRGLKPQSPLLKTTSLSRVSSPSLSLHSDQSRSPVISPIKPSVTPVSNHRLNSNSAQLEVKSSSQNYLQEAVPRTHSSNKRLRKDEVIIIDVEPPIKKQRLNGEILSGNNINSQVPSPTLKERNPELIEPSSNDEINVVKKRGRKKGSKSIKKQVSVEDSVKEKLASFSRNPKLKTTQELLADLQARGSNSIANLLPSHGVNNPNAKSVRNKKDSENHKYLSNNHNYSYKKLSPAEKGIKQESRKYVDSDSVDDDTRDSELATDDKIKTQDLTVEEILAKLPPLDRDSIDWGEDEKYDAQAGSEEADGEVNKSNVVKWEITEDDLVRLHRECNEGLNGNFQPKFWFPLENSDLSKTCNDDNEVKLEIDSVVGLQRPLDSHKDEVFREWHEMLARPSCDGQILHILPYVIID
ncbi:mediator of RNA polymerase II transcription subunit 26-like isoform X2 [Copidosoma floridanum]|nr:mediator of RNA polymerase II transcription subunit 26-like isoform X2 [Copidosoma floridanum]XP_014217320.1 mediator of RNA polymerase II transcription subunit 26-like isoform X2 [Copidosoma floridanum]